ncbi:MAG: hypothetical protein D3916_15240 [Candidatus Electrothrix sp. MAN1_4]|nr:hypothetical protein [Candidatus Electrothrix sp. MAN1_4]
MTLHSLRLNNGSTTLSGQELYGITVNVQNNGEVAAQNRFRIKYEISGPDVTDQWRLIADDGFDSVPFAQESDQVHSTNDSFAAAPDTGGEYRLRACVDYKEAVPESNEGNNCTEMTVSVSSTPATLKPVYRFWSSVHESHFYTISEDEKDHVIADLPNWEYEKIAFYAYENQEAGTLPVYRFWSSVHQSHFYTISEEEKDYVIANLPNWDYEKIAYYAYDYQKAGTLPVYRFWSSVHESHFYTISEEEKDYVIANLPNWDYEKIAWYAFPAPVARQPVYQFWSRTNKSHFYTISEQEKNDLITGSSPANWEYEHVAWFAYTYQQGDSLPVYRFWNATNKSHFYTISEEEKDYVIANYSDDEWQYEGAVFYAYKDYEIGTTPVYRFWSKTQNAHFYTASASEKDDLITNFPDVWQYEAEAWYVPLKP